MAEDSLLVRRIRNGTVIDHIPAGRALMVLRLLGIKGGEGLRVALVMNAESKKMGRKDIVKIEDRYLSKEETDKLALIAPTATINIIREFKVVEKRKVEPPLRITGILKCPNPTCITRKDNEPITPRFKRISLKPLLYQCEYCGTILDENTIIGQIVGEEY